jgi:hypothetical protein
VSDTTQPHETAPFDERAALAELEQLADKIQRSRQQRERAVAEFDAFVKAFRYERYSSSIAATERELRRADDRTAVPAVAAAQAGRMIAPASATSAPAPVSVSSLSAQAAAAASASVEQPALAETKPAFVAQSSSPQAIAPPAAEDSLPWGSGDDREAIAHAPVRLPAVRAAHVGVGLGTAAVLAVAVLLWRSSSAPVAPATPTNPSVAPAANAAAPAAQPETPTTAAPKPAVPAGPPRALNIEFITTRPVWARITIDGRKAMEREFPAEQRIPLGADRSILIRAGDAGAIRLIVDGKDLGPLGRDGQIFSRVFAPAAK